MKKILLLLAFVTTMLLSQQTQAQEKSKEQLYPVNLPTMSLIGLTSSCDGTIDSRRNTLEQLWAAFGKSQVFKGDDAIYRKKIYVVYYNHQPQSKAYSIFIGYLFVDWLGGKVTVKNQSTVVLDIPKGPYWAFDVRGTSANSIIKAWSMIYQSLPNDANKRSMEVYNLDSDNYTVQNVTLYVSK